MFWGTPYNFPWDVSEKQTYQLLHKFLFLKTITFRMSKKHYLVSCFSPFFSFQSFSFKNFNVILFEYLMIHMEKIKKNISLKLQGKTNEKRFTFNIFLYSLFYYWCLSVFIHLKWILFLSLRKYRKLLFLPASNLS